MAETPEHEIEGVEDFEFIKDQFENLKMRLDKLLKKTMDDEEKEPQCVDWSLYEQHIGADPLDFIKKHIDNQETKLEKLKKMKIKDLAGCLRFFKGNNFERKRKLFQFLRRAKGYKTYNIKLLEQRLFITRRWMKENHIDCPMEELPLKVNLDV